MKKPELLSLKNVELTVPPKYKAADFYAELKKFSEHTKIKLQDGIIKMGLAQRQYTFTKFGRKFSVDMFSFLGAVSISIKEDPCETE